MSDICDIVRDALNNECDVECGGAGCVHDQVRPIVTAEIERITADRDQLRAECARLKQRLADAHELNDAAARAVDALEDIQRRSLEAVIAQRDSALSELERVRGERDEFADAVIDSSRKRNAALIDLVRANAEREAAIARATKAEKDLDMALNRMDDYWNGIADARERDAAEAIAAWLDNEAHAMAIAYKHAPTNTEADACRREQQTLAQAAADIRSNAWRAAKEKP